MTGAGVLAKKGMSLNCKWVWLKGPPLDLNLKVLIGLNYLRKIVPRISSEPQILGHNRKKELKLQLIMSRVINRNK